MSALVKATVVTLSLLVGSIGVVNAATTADDASTTTSAPAKKHHKKHHHHKHHHHKHHAKAKADDATAPKAE